MGETVDFSNDSVKIKKMVFAALFAALIAVGAYIKIPITLLGVPITLQTFFVLLAVVTLGRNWGTMSIIVYLIVGFIGFPVFAGGNSGLGVLLGPTGGYLYSFIIVAFVIGWMSDVIKKKNSVVMFGLAALGSILILLIGTVHLGFSSDLPLKVAFIGGFIPFFVGDMIKSIAVGLVAPSLIKKVNFSSMSANEAESETGNEAETEIGNEAGNEVETETGNEVDNEAENDVGNESGNDLGNKAGNESQ